MKELKFVLMAAATTAIACVGKAEVSLIGPPLPGSGDDVIITSSCDFWLHLGEGVDSVTWSWTARNRSTSSSTIYSDYSDSRIPSGFTVSISSVGYKDWYVPDGDCKAGWSKSVGFNESVVNITVGAKRIYRKSNSDGSISVALDATPGQLGVASGYFADNGTSASDLSKVLTWSSLKNGGADAAINEITFGDDDEPTSLAAEAYLLNCAATSNAVADARAAFRFNSFTPGVLPTVADFDGRGYNGNVTIKGAVTFGSWHDVDEAGKIIVDGVAFTPRFFKAELRNAR